MSTTILLRGGDGDGVRYELDHNNPKPFFVIPVVRGCERKGWERRRRFVDTRRSWIDRILGRRPGFWVHEVRNPKTGGWENDTPFVSQRYRRTTEHEADGSLVYVHEVAE